MEEQQAADETALGEQEEEAEQERAVSRAAG